MPVSLGNNFASLTSEQLSSYHMGTIVPASLGKNVASLLLGNNYARLAWEQICQFRLGTIMSISLGDNCASLT